MTEQITILNPDNGGYLTCQPGPDGSCAICGDEALPGRVVKLLDNNMAAVEMNGRLVEVAIDLVDEVRVGDMLLVHLGFAIAILEPEQAE